MKPQIDQYLERKAQQDIILSLRGNAKVERLDQPAATPAPALPSRPNRRSPDRFGPPLSQQWRAAFAQTRSSSVTFSASAIFFIVCNVPSRLPVSICER